MWSFHAPDQGAPVEAPGNARTPSETERVEHLEEPEASEVGIARDDPGDAVFAHEHGDVEIVQEVATRLRQFLMHCAMTFACRSVATSSEVLAASRSACRNPRAAGKDQGRAKTRGSVLTRRNS